MCESVSESVREVRSGRFGYRVLLRVMADEVMEVVEELWSLLSSSRDS